MTENEWTEFAKRVPVGTLIKGEWYIGLLLENKPYTVEEFAENIASHRAQRRYKRDIKGAAMLKVQLFTHPMAFPIDCKYSQFFIGNRWLTFKEVMALEVSHD